MYIKYNILVNWRLLSMKKLLFISLFTFLSFNLFAQEINFSMYNNGDEVCPKVDFYGFTIKEFCRPVSPAGKAVIANTTINNTYQSLIAKLKEERYTPYEYLAEKLPNKSTTQNITINHDDENYSPEYVSIDGEFPELYGKIDYNIAKDKVIITILFNEKIKGTIEFIQQDKNVVINKDTEYLDFMVDNKMRTEGGMPVWSYAPNKNTSLHSYYGGGPELWVDSEFLAPVTFPSGKKYNNVNIALHKHVKKTGKKYSSTRELLDDIGFEGIEFSGQNNTIENESSRIEYKWINDALIIKEYALESEYTYYYKVTKNGNGAECTLLIFDYAP